MEDDISLSPRLIASPLMLLANTGSSNLSPSATQVA